MPEITAIYVVTWRQQRSAHARLAVARLRAVADRLIVVADAAAKDALQETLGACVPDEILTLSEKTSSLAGYRDALMHLRQTGQPLAGPLIVSSTEAFGPIGNLHGWIQAMQAQNGDLLAPYWHAPGLDPRLPTRGLPQRVAYLDFAVMSPALLADPGFWEFWARYKPGRDPWLDFTAGPVAFSAWMDKAGRRTVYAMEEGRLETAEPRLAEVHKLVEDGAPCLPVLAVTLDPLLHDLNATDLRAALDGLRTRDPELYATVIDFVSHQVPMRDFNTIADQYQIVAPQAENPDKTVWAFGKVAVFIHAFYAHMMPEFWELIERLPCEHHLFLTTASPEDKAAIETFLAEKGLNRDDFTVRVVEQNRGRDMSSLFITWRDVVLSDTYEVALRLHSKRTPQVSRQVGEEFKRHLFENLVGSRGHVANLLDMIEAEPDIGLVIPPVIHIGFGTLGHSWFNNKGEVQKLITDMGLDVRLDDSTPVAPYGTMYWFRTAALRPMFEKKWDWQAYNPEPHHVDGGLAHVQERLIGYVAQGCGFRVMTVMTPRLAARYYAKLEFKIQRLAAPLISGHILDQTAQTQSLGSTLGTRAFRHLRNSYGRALIRFPGLRGPLRPLKNLVLALARSQHKS